MNRHDRRKQAATQEHITNDEFGQMMQEPLVMKLVIAALLKKLGDQATLEQDDFKFNGYVMHSIGENGAVSLVRQEAGNSTAIGNA